MSLADDIRYGFVARHGAVARLIVINGAIYLGMALLAILGWLSGSLPMLEYYQYLYLPSDLSLLVQRPWTILTWMWVHDMKDVFHIIFNMLWLYWMGRILRQFAGDRTVWAAYVYGSLLGGLLYLILYNISPPFQGRLGLLFGASAGVNAIALAAATLVPDFTMYLLFFGAVRLKWVVFFMVVIDFVSILGGNPGGMFAHLGGALMGFLLIYARKQGTDLSTPFGRFSNLKMPGRIRKPVMEVSYRARNAQQGDASRGGAPTQAEIDRILDKISAEGYHKLTREEKQLLEAYSGK
jgi:membrane associated rhomboid family serine protease